MSLTYISNRATVDPLQCSARLQVHGEETKDLLLTFAGLDASYDLYCCHIADDVTMHCIKVIDS